MKRKLLVLTVGTIAAGVGLEFIKQVKAHPASELQAMVRCIDTARLANRYSMRDGEWFQMQVDPVYMKILYTERRNDPALNKMLYPGLLPKPTGVGGGSIRYNGAGAVIVNRDRLKKWLSANINSLIRQGDNQVNVSVALIVSAVGGTGSGSLEYLTEVIGDAFVEARVAIPIRTDIFILQPGMEGVSQLGLANTLALYAELAASRLIQDDIYDKRYQGRIIMVGWGSSRSLASIKQLEETAATLVRVIYDAVSFISAEYQEREVDNHVLLQVDDLTGMPTHLSSATPVTISLGRLEEQIIQKDAARLISDLVFGPQINSPVSTGDELFMGTLARSMAGENPEERYNQLLQYLIQSEDEGIPSLRKRFRQEALHYLPQEVVGKLEGIWLDDKTEIAHQTGAMRTVGNQLINEIVTSWLRLRRDGMVTNSTLSLSSLRGHYQRLKQTLSDTLNYAKVMVSVVPDDKRVIARLRDVEKTTKARWRRREQERQSAVDSAVREIQNNIQYHLARQANPVAIDVLEELFFRCSEALNSLDAVLQRLEKQRQTIDSWNITTRELNFDRSHPFELPALADKEAVENYYERVSIFTTRTYSRGMALTLTEMNQIADFRHWLGEQQSMDDLFKGDIDLLLRIAQIYTRDKVHEEVVKYSVLDVLMHSGEEALLQRLADAAELAHPLISFDKGLAPEREEVWHVCANLKDKDQRDKLQKAVDRVFPQGRCSVLDTNDLTEIVVFYYVDGIPASAVNDLTGRCLEAFLKLRRNWYKHSRSSGNSAANNPGQRVSIPIYSGREAEERVSQTEVIRLLYSLKGDYVGNYTAEEIPELGRDHLFEGEQTVHVEANVGVEGASVLEDVSSLFTRIVSIKQFLTSAGFDCDTDSNPIAPGFFALARASAWQERFPRGLYVRILFDSFLDQANVGKVYLEAKAYSDHALVIINQQPKLSGWMALGGLRTEEKERFVILPLAESLIKESIALNKEYQNLSLYVEKHLGKDFDPYDVRYPVADAVNFFGRESLTDEITHALKLGQSIGLFGLQKMGKSSVLKRVQNKVEFPAAYVYLSKSDSLDDIYERILERWSIDIRIKYPNLYWNPPQISQESKPRRILESSTKELLMLLASVTNTPLLAIFFDEIENIVPYKVGDEAALERYVNLMDSLRGLQQETNSLSLLVSGVHPDMARKNYFWGNQKNPMHQVISERFLLPLDQEDCAYMIRSLGQQINLTYDDEAVKYIIQLSGAHPFLTRRICSLAYKNRTTVEPFSVDYVQKVAQEFVSNRSTASYFDEYGLWAELGQESIWGKDVSYANHKILSSLAHSRGDLEEYELCSSLDIGIAKQALDALKERGAITCTKGKYYNITFGLFRNWINLRKPFEE